MRTRLFLVVLALVVAACSDSAGDTTTTTSEPTTTTTSEATTTTEETTTTTVAETTTTSEETTTTTTEAEDTTTTSEGEGGETTTTTEGEGGETTTTSSYPPSPTTSSTTIGTVDPDLEEWAGVFRSPNSYANFVQFRADGVFRAGNAFDDMPFEGTWSYDSADETITLDIDLGAGCGGEVGVYLRESARGGGRTLTVVDDPCADRVAFMTLPGATCECMTWLRVDEGTDDDE